MKGVSVDEDLRDQGSLHVDVLQLLWCNVLSLGELEDVLGAVDDLYVSVWEEAGNVARVYPAILCEGLCSPFWVLVVSLKRAGSPELKLASWIRLIGRCVVHLRDVL